MGSTCYRRVGVSVAIATTLIVIASKCESVPVKKSAVDSTTLSQTELGMAASQKISRKEQQTLEEQQQQQQQHQVRTRRDRGQQSELEDDEDQQQVVTIDLSALRPSLPGLVLYKYGELAPKLVQVDLDALNPELQPHVIWPEFQQQMNDLGDSFYDVVKQNLDEDEAIPFLSEQESLAPTHSHPKIARMMMMMSSPSEWSNIDDSPNSDDGYDNDDDDDVVFDFWPDALRNEELMTLHQSLPLADEVIVPLDWEEDERENRRSSTSDKTKKNVFVSQAWTPGGQLRPHVNGITRTKQGQRSRGPINSKMPEGITYTSPFGSSGWRPGKRLQESDKMENDSIEKEGEPSEADFKTESTISRSHTVTSGHKKNFYRTKDSRLPENEKTQQSGKIHKSSHVTNTNRTPIRTQEQGTWIWTPQTWNLPQIFTRY